MTILQELNRLYDARAGREKWAIPGFSAQGIKGVVVLSDDGAVREIYPFMEEGKPKPRKMAVPTGTRTSGVMSMRFWDKTAYSLGVVKTGDGFGQKKRTLREHDDFKEKHLAILADAGHPSLVALTRFCETWKPSMFADFPGAFDILDGNLVFQVEGSDAYLHDLDEARDILARTKENDSDCFSMCLVSGSMAPITKVHPDFNLGGKDKLRLVSAKNASETFHGRKQGANAPVSRQAASKYGIAFNALLAYGSGNNLKIGDDTVVFWADNPDVENTVDAFLSGQGEEDEERKLRDVIVSVANGRKPSGTNLDPETRLFVLGVTAANKARLAVRHWYPGSLGDFARNVSSFWDDMAIRPSPFTRNGKETAPKMWSLLYEVALNRKKENIPPKLGSDLMRSVIDGGLYPSTLLTGTMARIRAEGEPDRKKHGNVDGRRAALVAAVLKRNKKKELPVALNENETSPAYQLGRLFGVYVYAEKRNQDRGAGLRQKYFAGASATPAAVFPKIMKGYEHNLASIEKKKGKGVAIWIDRAAQQIMGQLDSGLPRTLPLEDQGLFFIGFYHQLQEFYKEKDADDDDVIDQEDHSGEGDDQ